MWADNERQAFGDRTQGRPGGSRAARVPGLLAAVGAVLLMCAPALPGHSRLVVLPALLLAPGYAFLRLLGRADDWHSVSVAVPTSIVLVACVSLALDVSGVRLGPVSLGLTLGAVTAIFLAGSYGRRLVAGRSGVHRRPPSGDRDLFRPDAAVGERR